MSVGFVTASGKGITVSEEALQKARQLFQLLDSDDNDGLIRADSAHCSSVENG